MLCPKCQQSMRIANNKYTTEKIPEKVITEQVTETAPDGTETIVEVIKEIIPEVINMYNVIELVCINQSCELGTTIENPDTTKVQIVKNKVN